MKLIYKYQVEFLKKYSPLEQAEHFISDQSYYLVLKSQNKQIYT